MANYVTLVGARPQTELAQWYSAADLFCLASHCEGCPNVVLEAMACGVPVVAADVGGIGELTTTPEYGRLVSVSKEAITGFAEQIGQALNADWNRAEIAGYGGKRSWKDVAIEMKDLLRSVAEKPSR